MRIKNALIRKAFKEKLSKKAQSLPIEINITSTMCIFFWPNGRKTRKNVALIGCDMMQTRIIFHLCRIEKDGEEYGKFKIPVLLYEI